MEPITGIGKRLLVPRGLVCVCVFGLSWGDNAAPGADPCAESEQVVGPPPQSTASCVRACVRACGPRPFEDGVCRREPKTSPCELSDPEILGPRTGLMWESAPQFGALLIFAEHRYFGDSQPFPNVTSHPGRPDPALLGWLSAARLSIIAPGV